MQKTAGAIFIVVPALAGVAASMTNMRLTDSATLALFILCLFLFVLGVALTCWPRGKAAMTDAKPKRTSNLWGGIFVEGGGENNFTVGSINAVYPVVSRDTSGNTLTAGEINAAEPTGDQIAAQVARDKADKD